jgi:hypothetical protein
MYQLSTSDLELLFNTDDTHNRIETEYLNDVSYSSYKYSYEEYLTIKESELVNQ